VFGVCENEGYRRLTYKAAMVVIPGLLAIFRPEWLVSFFTFPIFFFRVYHVLWLMAILILFKRFIPRLNPKMSLGKIYARNFLSAGEITPPREKRYRESKRKADSGAMRSAIYWILLVLTIGFWRKAGMLSDTWIYIIVLFFVFMDQFCSTLFCPFMWLAQSKCCNTCRINNWGYMMAFSPMIYIPSFWTYSILFMSAATLIQWEFLYLRHPERFYEQYNANLMCKNCKRKVCKRTGKKLIADSS
jgi:hypothetical protein